MINVLCVTDYFLPGYKGGGLITTLVNMREQFSGQIAMSIFTRDRDLGALEPYANIDRGCWTETSAGAVFYAPPNLFGPRVLKMALAKRPANVLYLNSFFSPWGSISLHLLRSWIAPGLPILIAPRGEFSPGALSVKTAKKRLYIGFVHAMGLYQDVYWHASTDFEFRDILQQFPRSESRIHTAPDPVVAECYNPVSGVISKQVNQLKSIFISRICPKKNLDGLLEILSVVRAQVSLDVIGPIEDESYWWKCKMLIEKLPKNIQVKYMGPIAPDEVLNAFARYDLFVFPTHGENFGHVIFEALRAGTPVLLSDRTPWQPDNAGAVTVLSLDKVSDWHKAIEHAARRAPKEQKDLRLAAHDYVSRYLASDTSLRQNINMFKYFMSPCQ